MLRALKRCAPHHSYTGMASLREATLSPAHEMLCYWSKLEAISPGMGKMRGCEPVCSEHHNEQMKLHMKYSSPNDSAHSHANDRIPGLHEIWTGQHHLAGILPVVL